MPPTVLVAPVLKKTAFNYAYLGATATESIRLVRRIRVAPFYRVRLIVRIHALTIGSRQSFAFVLSNTLPDDESPQEFSWDPSLTQFLTVTIDNTSPSPPVIVSGTAADPGAELKLTLVASQGTTPGATLYGEFSAVLLGRHE